MTPLKSTWHHIRRSPIQSFTAFFIMVIGYLIINSFFIFNDGLSSVLHYFETKPEITIFLNDGLDKDTVETLQKELASYANVREIKFISKEKALDIYKEQNKDNPMLTEMVTASILPASFEISVSDPAVLEQISQNFSAKTNVIDEIIYQKDVINSLLNWTNVARKTSLLSIAAVAVIAFFVNFVIIGLKITNRKEEIRISRLLGASKFYVKKPFLLEGVLYGFFGSLLGSSISFILAYQYGQQINLFFQPISFIRTSDFTPYLIAFALQLFTGTFLGYLASWLTVKRYIKF